MDYRESVHQLRHRKDRTAVSQASKWKVNDVSGYLLTSSLQADLAYWVNRQGLNSGGHGIGPGAGLDGFLSAYEPGIGAGSFDASVW